jgi:hypothetical protein
MRSSAYAGGRHESRIHEAAVRFETGCYLAPGCPSHGRSDYGLSYAHSRSYAASYVLAVTPAAVPTAGVSDNFVLARC